MTMSLILKSHNNIIDELPNHINSATQLVKKAEPEALSHGAQATTLH
jgi:hypothetical protein